MRAGRRALSLCLLALFYFSGLSASAQEKNCREQFEVIQINASHFSSSAFGLVHADRPGNALYSQWSAETSGEVLKAIREGKRPEDLFAIGVKARQEFARKFEGVEKPELDFGSPRQVRSPHLSGEDMMGLSTRTLAQGRAIRLPEKFSGWPNRWWVNIAQNQSRAELADSIIDHLRKTLPMSTTDRDLLIVDRQYQTLNGQVFKSSSTKFERAIHGAKDSPYFVSTLNVPKPEIDPIMADVYRRITLALKSGDRAEARENLAHAMYGFFNAMPYYRGSAAIGRVVFTALFSQIEGKAVIIHPECDVKALIHTQGEYLSMLPSLVRSK